LEKELIFRFKETIPVEIGSLTIHAYKKFHDAGDPHSFTVSSATVRVGVFTDIGAVCKKTIQHFAKCHAAFLESNYDEDMLMNGSYPYILKKRISDGNGHLSNDEALELFIKHKPGFMSHLILSHLSKNNNTPEIVHNLFMAHANGVKIIVASRYEESKLYKIETAGPYSIVKKPGTSKHKQLSLF
jgi:phosphoribosyl 1,2-cyclic phosphodiesterase